jgi:hypothetical protein
VVAQAPPVDINEISVKEVNYSSRNVSKNISKDLKNEEKESIERQLS